MKPSIPAESSEVVLLQDTVAGVSLTVCERFIRVGETEIPMEHSISFAAASGRFFLVADRREIRVFSVSGETPSVCVSITAGEDISSLALEEDGETPVVAVGEWRSNRLWIYRGDRRVSGEQLGSCVESSLFSRQKDGLFLLVSCVDGSLRIFRESEVNGGDDGDGDDDGGDGTMNHNGVSYDGTMNHNSTMNHNGVSYDGTNHDSTIHDNTMNHDINTMNHTINTNPTNPVNPTNPINHAINTTRWTEERSFHVTRSAGRWLRSDDPSLFLLLGRKSCVLLHSNAAWM